MRRYKDRIDSHRPAAGPEVLVHYEVMEQIAQAAPESRPPEYKVVKSSKFFAMPLSVDEAIMQMNLLGNDFLVFTNAESRDVNVVYKRGDGNYGLIETGRSAE